MTSDKWQVTSDMRPAAVRERPSASCHLSPVTCHVHAFTLVELLLVISIMGLIAALAVPALRTLGKSNVQAGAARQILDDVGRARQLAISDHTTVYMIFVRTNFWGQVWPTPSDGIYGTWWNNLQMTAAMRGVASNLCDKQLTGYTFVSLRSVGDQPGQGRAHYLAPWQSLPDGTFIAERKFQLASNFYYNVYGNKATYPVHGFCQADNIPFPTEDSPIPSTPPNSPPKFSLPYIAFNYLGQLTFDGQNMAQWDEYIPLAEGTVSPAINVNTKTPVMGTGDSPTVTETPPGNSTNSMYRIVHIDRLTGRATLEYQHVQ